MWISNTATAIMMLPIASSVIAILEPEQRDKLARPILLSVAWAANIGGMATLIGTPPNMIFAGFMSEQLNRQIGFVEWLPIGLSASTLLGTIAYSILRRGLGHNELSPSEEARTRNWLKDEWSRLGTLSTAQRRVAMVFALTAMFWILRPYLSVWIPVIQWSGYRYRIRSCRTLICDVGWLREKYFGLGGYESLTVGDFTSFRRRIGIGRYITGQ